MNDFKNNLNENGAVVTAHEWIESSYLSPPKF